MIRQILCKQCAGKGQSLHPDDKRNGWKARDVFLSVKTPPGHGISINGKFVQMKDIMCDHCNEVITGAVVVARTSWRGEDEPHIWEEEYGTILPPEAVKLEMELSK